MDRENSVKINLDNLDEIFENHAIQTLYFRDLADDLQLEVDRLLLCLSSAKDNLKSFEASCFVKYKKEKADGKVVSDSYANACVQCDPERKEFFEACIKVQKELNTTKSLARKAENVVHAMQVKKNSVEKIEDRMARGAYIRSAASRQNIKNNKNKLKNKLKKRRDKCLNYHKKLKTKKRKQQKKSLV